jgi:hypothetical protein
MMVNLVQFISVFLVITNLLNISLIGSKRNECNM